MEDFVKVCSTDDVPDDTALAVEIEGRPVAIFKVGDRFYAVEDVCPHQGASFEGGALDDEIVTCPQHGWRLNVITGGSLEAPGIKIETYDVEIVDDNIYVRM
jgi:nitrite reductase (NADH) small subunit/3-phenylpropionate/trans-cinnamate dioxygenase ferredoxin subunit